MPRVVVCGAGSAGCVVAARLAEDPENEVVVIEAGPDYPTVEDMPAAIRNAYIGAGAAVGAHHDWGYFDAGLTTLNPRYADIPGKRMPVFRGKVVGGSSAVNAANFLRPHEDDFDTWVAMGASEWSWAQVRETLCQLEADPLGGQWHGTQGRVPVTRASREELRPILRDFLDACAGQGHQVLGDLNAPGAVGAGPIPFNTRAGVRQSAAVTYLSEARRRTNLSILADTEVDRVLFRGPAAVGVRLASGEEVAADLVVLAAGAVGSPAILMRSGVGPQAHLEELGITVRVANDAVGGNLQDHPISTLEFSMTPDPTDTSSATLQTMLTCCSSGTQDQRQLDLNIAPFVSGPDHVFVSVGLVKSRSVGYVRLRSSDVHVAPEIQLNYFSHPDDLPRLIRGVQLAREILSSPQLSRYALTEVFPGPAVAGADEIGESIRSSPYSYAHASGTCRMGHRVSAGAVVDQFGAVHGLERLSVVDASIMPSIP
ncbi:MAG TPA: GMC family oxidoreductase N-terminal domain-containing protein, partial [Jatrophihabitantaceae bacterium]|nr:GMC family oxidoreductase N-terminal domain-containing protein [Jatrophihabitantaceae bacterium]